VLADFGMGAVEWDMHEVLQRMQNGELTSPELMQVPCSAGSRVSSCTINHGTLDSPQSDADQSADPCFMICICSMTYTFANISCTSA
jgi:hypothetical protein